MEAVGRGVGGVPRGLKAAGAAPWPTPAAPGAGAPPGPRSGRCGPRGVHTELLRFMRPRKVDRLCRPVDTELMAERCAPPHRQRCEGVSL